MTASTPLTIDVISDVMCPWCYIGKRRLESALKSVPDVMVEVRWHPFQLDDTLPAEGKDRSQYLSDKFGGRERAQAVYSQISQAGKQEGIPFAFDRIQTSPNTLDSHRLILWSKADGLQNEVVERLFKAYFIDGEDLTQPGTLVQIAEDAGMEADLVEQLLETDSDLEKTKKQIGQAHEMGVTGVPFFIIDGRFAVAGAEKPETIAAAIMHAEATKAGEQA
ncbi:DSBA oxidoreductase [Roseibium aquae]|uniref:DSBA oxidoreductase n=1 Tax=Roseibium aquae TaxID=1323746 RepID=A0A916TI40_9HYPH|nr:DsbA family oxidoreductase [Roseibium aquae]GGB45268.1 DSBA oxidoreductase [Roseibium aquae]